MNDSHRDVPYEQADFEEPAVSISGDDVDRLWRRLKASREPRKLWLLVAAAAALVLAVSSVAVGLAVWPDSDETAITATKVVCSSAEGVTETWLTTVPELLDLAAWRHVCGESSPAGSSGPVIASGRAVTVCRVAFDRFEVSFGVPRTCPTSS